MSSPQDSKTQRAADKVDEGARLLSAGDYEGAIAAYTEAIDLDPSFGWAYYYRAEARKRLGMLSKSEADREHMVEPKGETFTVNPDGISGLF